jgi:hypothetical protein
MIWSESFVPYGAGRKAAVGGLADAALLDRLLRYKRQVAKRYRVLESAKIDSALPAGTLWMSPKLDGELWFLVRRGGDLALCAHNGRVLHGIPLLTALAARLKDAPDLVIAGELVAPLGDGRPRSHHVATAFGDPALAKHFAFHAFDLVEDGAADALGRPYGERLARLQALLGEAGVITTVTGDAAAAASHYREWVAAGKHEGLVVRTEQNLTFKVKPHFTIDAVVIAYGERLVGETRQLRELSVALRRDDGTWQVLGSVGGGFSEEDRVAWHRRLGGMESSSSFRMANSEGTLSRLVRPEIVIEVRCSDLLVSDGEDAAIRRMSLAWDAAAGWTPIGEQITAAMLHPVFLRERTDKRPDAGDCGLTQLTSRVQFEDDVAATGAASGSATVLARGVWSKDNKGQLAVRKYVLIQTNATRDHAPLVLFCTDFSPGRAEPLQTTVRTAATRAGADAQIAAWIDENIKKGWNPAGPGAPVRAAAAVQADAPPAEGAPAPKKRSTKKPTA